MKNLRLIFGAVAVVALCFVLPIAAETISGTQTAFPALTVSPSITVSDTNSAFVKAQNTTDANERFVQIFSEVGSSALDFSHVDTTGNFTCTTGAGCSLSGDPTLTINSSLGGGLITTIAPFKIGASGTAISTTIRGTVTTDVASVAANACNADIAITVTGAVAGSECIVGMPATTPALLQGTCFVSATNTVQLRICNGTNAASADPANATYSARVFNP